MRVAVTGHRGFDGPVTALIDGAVRTWLARWEMPAGELTGISCLAEGTDVLFAAAVLDLGGTLEAVVPARRYRASLPRHARPVYDELLGRACTVHHCDHEEPGPEAYMDASRLMVDRAEHLLAVWDGLPARSYGGTADVVAHARGTGTPVTVLWPVGAYRD